LNVKVNVIADDDVDRLKIGHVWASKLTPRERAAYTALALVATQPIPTMTLDVLARQANMSKAQMQKCIYSLSAHGLVSGLA